MAKEATNPELSMQREWYCLAVHKNIHECSFEYVAAEETDRRKSQISSSSSSFSYKTLDWHSLQTKAVIELLHTQNDIVFVAAAFFNLFVCKLAQVAVLSSCGSTKYNTTPFLFWATNKVEVQTCTYCACAVHMLTHFTTLLMMVSFEVLTESLSIWHLVAHDH